MRTIEQNWEKEKNLQKYKKEHGVPPWRAFGTTTRVLFDMASYYPHGEFVFICHSHQMARMCFKKFIEIQTFVEAPIRINKNRLIVMLHDATYEFTANHTHLRERLHPDTKIFEDHYKGY